MSVKVIITAPQSQIELDALPGARLDELVLAAGILVDRPCGGRGSCGKCRLPVSGPLTSPTATEKKVLGEGRLAAGERLLCQCRVAEGEGPVKIRYAERVVFTDKSFQATRDLAELGEDFGLAVDLGTTTVAVFVVGLDSGRVRAGAAALNPQAAHGAEVMSRLESGDRAPGLMRDLAFAGIKSAARALDLSEVVRGRVRRAVIVGNSAMHHLVAGLEVKSLLRSPFTPVDAGAVDLGPGVLHDLFGSLESILVAPLIGGFVGGDALACMLYFNLDEGGSSLVVDLGTNGEVMLSKGGNIVATSAAAGPAFEAVNVSCGMRAGRGAVDRVSFVEGKGVEAHVIGDAEPAGLCGSGLVSAVNAMVKAGGVAESGRVAATGQAGGLEIVEDGQERRIRLAGRVFLSQSDVRELQKAKAAIRAAADTLLDREGLRAGELERIILTGGFGGKLDPRDVIDLGILPPVPVSRIMSIPNGAGMGAALMLDGEGFGRAIRVASMSRHVELNLDPVFMDRYISSMILR